jgi:TonB family protein
MPLRPTPALALAGALAFLAAGCASAGGSAPPASSAACASAGASDDAGLAAAFDSLHALRLRGRAARDLVLAPHDRKPKLENTAEVRRLLETTYPPLLRDAGVTGSSEVAMLVDATGTVRSVLLVRGSAHGELDRASIAVVKAMRFQPARQGSCPVPFFSSLPINWHLEKTRP